ncbi:MAG: shikimate dehydrogenase [Ignavibacteriales bacterium]
MVDFGFVTHPLDVTDIGSRYPITRYLPPSWIEEVGRRVLPIRKDRVTGIRSPWGSAGGWLITFALTARQMEILPRPFILDRIARSVRLARRLGAGIVGLGGLASVIGGEDPDLAGRLNVAVTTGENYNVAVALDAARMAAGLVGKTLSFAEVTVLGGEGHAGAAMARLLAREAHGMTLVATDPARIRRLSAVITRETGLTPKITADGGRAVHQCDIVVCTGGWTVDPRDPRPGAVFCGVGGPPGSSRRVREVRKDVLVIEGGLVEIPGDVRCASAGFNPQLCDPRLAEVMILAIEGEREDSGATAGVTVERVDRLSSLARRYGFRLAGLLGPDRPVTGDEIAEAKRAACQGFRKLGAVGEEDRR